MANKYLLTNKDSKDSKVDSRLVEEIIAHNIDWYIHFEEWVFRAVQNYTLEAISQYSQVKVMVLRFPIWKSAPGNGGPSSHVRIQQSNAIQQSR